MIYFLITLNTMFVLRRTHLPQYDKAVIRTRGDHVGGHARVWTPRHIADPASMGLLGTLAHLMGQDPLIRCVSEIPYSNLNMD